MSHHYPPNQGPYGGYGPPPAPTPPPPRKRKTGKVIAGIAGGVVLLGIIVSATSDPKDTSSDDARTTDTAPAVQEPKEKTEEQPKAVEEDKPAATEADRFEACVSDKGTPTEKAAVKHVTKVSGVEDFNNILDAPDVFTDFTGGLMGSDTGQAKLVASAFASCYESENGLVTIYGSDGDMIANGKF